MGKVIDFYKAGGGTRVKNREELLRELTDFIARNIKDNLSASSININIKNGAGEHCNVDDSCLGELTKRQEKTVTTEVDGKKTVFKIEIYEPI